MKNRNNRPTPINRLTGKIFLSIATCALITGCTKTPDLPLGQEFKPAGEDQITQDISTLLSDHLREQYHDERFLRDTHPKDNGCIRGTFKVNDDIPQNLQTGVFSKDSEHPVWIRFSNSVEEITDDHETDFRGLGMKLTQVDGERLPSPGDENHSQDFLFLGHDAFFAGNPQEFFDFFDAAFSGTSWRFLLTHPKGTVNILQGRKRYKNPLDLHWNSVTPYALGEASNGTYPHVMRYGLRSCASNSGEIPPEPSPDYLSENLTEQLSNGTACLDFMVQLQTDPQSMPTENALVAWDQEASPFIPIARIDIPSQTFTSEAQKEFCENISFNPWHGLKVHRPLGGINRARRVVMKNISDLRLKENGVERTEPTGKEVF